MKQLLLIILLFSLWSCGEKTEQEKETRETVLIELAKQDAMERLKSPSTAVFVDSLSTVTRLKGESGLSESYRVNIHVDAQNSLVLC